MNVCKQITICDCIKSLQTTYFCFFWLSVCMDLSAAHSFFNFLTLFVWLGPCSTVGFACAHEWLRAAQVASAKPGIVP